MSRPSSNYSKEEQKKHHIYLCVLYPDSQSYNCDCLLNRLSSYWDLYYYILHDKDIYTSDDLEDWLESNNGNYPEWKPGDIKKPHYHVIGYVENACMLGRAAKKFGIPVSSIKFSSNLKKAVQYLIHINHPNKYQYQEEEVITNDDKIATKLKKEVDAEEKASLLIEAIFMSDISSISALAQFALQNHCWDELRRGQHLYTALIHEKRIKNFKENL